MTGQASASSRRRCRAARASDDGLQAALGMLTSEMRRSMALAGLRNLAEIDRSVVRRVGTTG